MISEGIIEKIFTDIIVKHGKFYSSLTQLKEITDSKEEYKLLKESIWEFHKNQKSFNKHYKENFGYKVECLQAGNYKGDTYYTTSYQEHQVNYNVNMTYDGLTEGLLYTIHNHPTTTSMASEKDFENMIDLNTKYSIIEGDEGVFVMKNTREPVFVEDKYKGSKLEKTEKMLKYAKEKLPLDLSINTYGQITYDIAKDIQKNTKKEVDKLYLEYEQGKYTPHELTQQIKQVEDNYLTQNMETYIQQANNEFQKENINYIQLNHITPKGE